MRDAASDYADDLDFDDADVEAVLQLGTCAPLPGCAVRGGGSAALAHSVVAVGGINDEEDDPLRCMRMLTHSPQDGRVRMTSRLRLSAESGGP